MWCTYGQEKLWFIWKIPQDSKKYDPQKSKDTANEIENTHMTQYHSRFMKNDFVSRYTLLLHARAQKTFSNSAMLHEMYQELTGDCMSASQRVSKAVKTRLRFLLDSEDSDLAVDLRQFNSGPPTKYDRFFEGVQSYINENSLEAAQERRHDSISRMALAISVPDLIRQVEKTLPPETPIPSETYVRLQFWPKNKHFQSALHYTGKFHIKYMVQTRQIRLSHVDAHYAAATYRYLKEFCVKFRDFCTVLCINDKHQVKLGEPGFPIACTDRGRAAVVHVPSQEQHSAGDHDFSQLSN
ncbi:hypothetical protein SNE40_010265 [Patella caerulea]|uniref:Uncharacterized protein n=1 Tax=Patella caerulea TaxID=87958 RepID=A0AAN8PSN2_PATCE